MRLVNKTKGKIIAKNVIMKVSIPEIMLGLIPYKIKNRYVYDWMKNKIFDEEDAMFFKVSSSGLIHSLFMSFPIVLVFLDEEMRVVEKSILEPFRFYLPRKKFEYFVELLDTKSKDVDIGDKVIFE